MMRWLAVAGFLSALVLATSTASADEPRGGRKIDPEKLFKRLDANGDGKLSKEEFLKLAELRQGQGDVDQRKERLEKLFDKLDTNGDGFLSLEEFKNITELRGRRGGAGKPDSDK